jgi:hypothetical protein
LIYDDYTAESYGDSGSIEWYLAVRFTPASYPAQLKTARFYVHDTTTYPFELNIWDDDGPGEIPGTSLITPFTVDPVVPSTLVPSVAWFDVDLSEHNITIESGDFYIGVRQIEVGKLNRLGFDMAGDTYVPYTRSWAYTFDPFTWQVHWLNLDYLCQYWSSEF